MRHIFIYNFVHFVFFRPQCCAVVVQYNRNNSNNNNNHVIIIVVPRPAFASPGPDVEGWRGGDEAFGPTTDVACVIIAVVKAGTGPRRWSRAHGGVRAALLPHPVTNINPSPARLFPVPGSSRPRPRP